MKKTVLITGSSSGFGKLAAKKFQAEGWNVAATMRSPENETELNKLDNVLVTQLDVTDSDSIKSSIQEVNKKFGGIDVLVNNAGYGAMGVFEAATQEQIRMQFEVNFFGLINVTRAVLPIMKAQKSGTIINVSSIGGRVTFPYISFYHASKFAVEGLTETLQYELNPLGIKLKIIEPGAYNTDFGSRSLTLFDASNYPEYSEHFGKFVATTQQMIDQSGNPQEVADIIFTAATDDSELLRYPVGADALQTLEARKNMTDIEFKGMVNQLMGTV